MRVPGVARRRRTPSKSLFTHRDLAYDWNDRRTRVRRERHRVSYLQSTVLHELGHTLGLGHVNGGGNSETNYGIT